MAPKSKTATSTPRLSEYAQHFSFPAGIARTVWPRVEAKGKELGLGFDWWQSQLGTVCLGYGPDGRYVATVGGVGLSIPRQVGKTYFVLAMLVVMCILFPGLQVVWTAHHLRTSTKTFTALRGICRRRKVAPHVRAMRAANGEQQVEFVNGSMIMFGARSMGFGRGFDEIDIEVFDEAQILDTKALEDMIAATNQARHEHGALLFFMGTPPRPTDPSEAFTERRREARAGIADDAVWLEIGATPGSDPDDRVQWQRMNPSFPKRTPLESLLRLRKNLKDEDSWNREGRGIWDDAAASTLMPLWGDGAVDSFDLEPVGAVGVAVSVDREWGSIGAADKRDGVMHVGTVKRAPGTHWIAEEARRIYKTYGCPIVVDSRGPGADLIDDLQDAGAWVVEANTQQYLDGCAELFDGVAGRKVIHMSGDSELNTAVAGAGKRPVGDRWAWSRTKSTNDVSALEAVTLAAWAVNYIGGGVILG